MLSGGVILKNQGKDIEKLIDIEALERAYLSELIVRDDGSVAIPYVLMEKMLLIVIYKKLCNSENNADKNSDNR